VIIQQIADVWRGWSLEIRSLICSSMARDGCSGYDAMRRVLGVFGAPHWSNQMSAELSIQQDAICRCFSSATWHPIYLYSSYIHLIFLYPYVSLYYYILLICTYMYVTLAPQIYQNALQDCELPPFSNLFVSNRWESRRYVGLGNRSLPPLPCSKSTHPVGGKAIGGLGPSSCLDCVSRSASWGNPGTSWKSRSLKAPILINIINQELENQTNQTFIFSMKTLERIGTPGYILVEFSIDRRWIFCSKRLVEFSKCRK